MAPAFRPRRPVTGQPGGVGSKFLRVDFNPTDVFDSLIETKTPRIGWARATRCPCRGPNPQAANQSDPNCPKCNALGFQYFRPKNYTVNTKALGNFTGEQQATLNRANAVAIRGLMTGIEHDPDMFRILGNWADGVARLTLRGENRPGYYDRIISVDELMVYTETWDCDGTGEIHTRYFVNALNDLRSMDKEFDEPDVFLQNGVVKWKPGKEPPSGTRVSLNYLCHPVWIVMNHIHVIRSSLAKFRKKPSSLQTPGGDTIVLPNQVLVKLEHLELAMRNAAP